jgi:hypothetical protein
VGRQGGDDVDQHARGRVHDQPEALGHEVVVADPKWIGTRASAGSVIQPYQATPIIASRSTPPITAARALTASALVRAVVFDGLGLDHPAVRTLLARPAWEGGGGWVAAALSGPDGREMRVSLSRAGVCQGCVRPRCA